MGAIRHPTADRAAPPAPPGRTFLAGDPLRAIACLAVFLFLVHASTSAMIGSGSGQLANANPGSRWMYGPILGVVLVSLFNCVPIFFSLSAYLIARPIMRAFIDGNPIPSVPRYLRARVFRIVPAFWAIFGAVILLYGLHGATARQTATAFVFDTDWRKGPFTQVMGQPWTLNIEVRF